MKIPEESMRRLGLGESREQMADAVPELEKFIEDNKDTLSDLNAAAIAALSNRNGVPIQIASRLDVIATSVDIGKYFFVIGYLVGYSRGRDSNNKSAREEPTCDKPACGEPACD